MYSHEQQRIGPLLGTRLYELLIGFNHACACVLDQLFAASDQLPDSWKRDDQDRMLCIYFWGTIYQDEQGNAYVQYLCFDEGVWTVATDYLGAGYLVTDVAACFLT